jgi:hypothetical protein
MPIPSCVGCRPAIVPTLTQPHLEAARQWLRVKEEIVEQVSRGQMGLLEAAARFQAVNRLVAQSYLGPVLGLESQDAEGACRTVIAWAGLALADRPEQAAVVHDRLEAELSLNLQRSGGVQLPVLN